MFRHVECDWIKHCNDGGRRIRQRECGVVKNLRCPEIMCRSGIKKRIQGNMLMQVT